jgi:hypothetical protein
MLWKNTSVRQIMLAHWSDSKHSCQYRFLENQETIEEVLGSESSDVELDRDLRKRNLSLRAVVREIPPKFVNAKISE